MRFSGVHDLGGGCVFRGLYGILFIWMVRMLCCLPRTVKTRVTDDQRRGTGNYKAGTGKDTMTTNQWIV